MLDEGLPRREFLRLTVGSSGALLVGFTLEGTVLGQALPGLSDEAAEKRPEGWLKIHPDNTVTIFVNRPEMGQGTMTAMPLLVAEELDLELEQVRAEMAPYTPFFDRSPLVYTVGGSGSVRTSWKPLRRVGATLRRMLLQAAAARWNVDVAGCTTRAGQVIHKSSRRHLPYCDLIQALPSMPVPGDVPLKPPEEFRLLGKPQPRLDTPAKTRGEPLFGIDVEIPNLLVGVVARPPVFEADLVKLDDSRARTLSGVRHVVRLGSRVGVVAEDFWSALKGRRALSLTWKGGASRGRHSGEISKQLRDAAAKTTPHFVPFQKGNVEDAFKEAAHSVRAEYEVPYQAHAAMEPMTCTAHVREGACDLWVPVQSAGFAAGLAARISGLDRGKVRVHPCYMGGSFGRKFTSDYISDAVELSRATSRPVKVIWTREDDIRHARYRPVMFSRMEAALDSKGRPLGWQHLFVGPSFRVQFGGLESVRRRGKGYDSSTVGGAAPPMYPVPNIRVSQRYEDPGVPVMWWRSVANSFTAFFVESFIDELAHAAAIDPVTYRLDLLRSSQINDLQATGRDFPPFRPQKMARVIELAAARSGWKKFRSPKRALGLAAHYSFGTFVAQVVEVSVVTDGIKVHRVHCVVDCGQTVNPNTVEAQMEGSIIFGLTAALKSSITIKDGHVEQSNFDDFPILRIDEIPEIDVHIVPGHDDPGGVGEPGLPPVAPALANAVFRLTGKRIRKLPILASDL